MYFSYWHKASSKCVKSSLRTSFELQYPAQSSAAQPTCPNHLAARVQRWLTRFHLCTVHVEGSVAFQKTVSMGKTPILTIHSLQQCTAIFCMEITKKLMLEGNKREPWMWIALQFGFDGRWKYQQMRTTSLSSFIKMLLAQCTHMPSQNKKLLIICLTICTVHSTEARCRAFFLTSPTSVCRLQCETPVFSYPSLQGCWCLWQSNAQNLDFHCNNTGRRHWRHY